MRLRAISFGLFFFCVAFMVSVQQSFAEPVFHISFQQGLLPEIGPEKEAEWTGQALPSYYEKGIRGQAIVVGDVDGTLRSPEIKFDSLPKTGESGTMLFWIRGVKNWDLYRTAYDTPPGPSQNIAAGGGTMWRWNYDTGGVKIFAGSPGPTYRQIFYPRFEQYRWNHIGYSWQDGHLRLYLNGEIVNEDAAFGMHFGDFSLAGGSAHKDSIRLYDDLKIWKRALSKSEVKRLYRHDFQLANRPLVTAGYMYNAPVIDGDISPEEWQGASVVTGVLSSDKGERAQDQSVFYIGYDDAFLYLAMSGDMTELARTSPALVYEVFLNIEGDLRADDLVEIILSPGYFRTDLSGIGYWDREERKHVSGTTGDTFFQTQSLGDWREYRFLGNAGQERREAVYGPGGRDEGWSSRWNTASAVSSEGWQFEARIPIDSVGGKAPEGEEWGFQLARIWRHLKQEENVWAWGYREVAGREQGSYVKEIEGSDTASLGVLRFGRKGEPVVRVKKTGTLEEHMIDWQAEVANPSEDACSVKVRLFTDTPELLYEEVFNLNVGETLDFSKNHRISDFGTSVVNFEVYSGAGTLLHRTSVPFYLEEKFGLNVRPFPNEDRFLLDLDLGTLSHVPVEELSVSLKMAGMDGAMVFSPEDKRVAGYVDSLEYQTDSIVTGDYLMTVRVYGGEEVLAEEEIEFAKVGKAVWYDNLYGLEDMKDDIVPYPWTDIVVDDNTLGVWGRSYTYGDSLLPEQVTALGYPVLRGPMRLIMELSDGEVVELSNRDVESRWTMEKRTRVEGIRLLEDSGQRLRNDLWVEYDGFVWNSITIEPLESIESVSLRLEVPLTPDFSDVNYRGWYGNGDGGIQFFGGKSREVVRVPEGQTVYITISDEPSILQSPYSFDIGFIATPVRPKTWRTPEFQPRAVHGGGPWYPEGLEFMPAADIGRGYYSLHGRIYVHTDPVGRGSNDALGSYDFDNYVYEWLSNPNERVLSTQKRAQPTMRSKSYRDYFVWRHWRYKQNYGFAGLYYDNPLQDDLLGSRELIKRMYNITLANQYFGAREQAVGIAVNGNINMSFMGFITYHWDGEHLNSVVQGWRSYIGHITPESFRRQYMGHNLGFPSRFLGQNRLRDEWVEADGGAEAVYDHFSGLALLHDAAVTAPMLPCCLMKGARRGAEKRMVDTLERLNFYHWKYQFTPYWKQEIVELPHGDMYASFYIARPSVLTATDPMEHMNRSRIFRSYFDMGQHLPAHMLSRMPGEIERERKYLEKMKDRAIMVVYNHSEWEGEMRLNIDWDKLGLGAPGDITLENAVHSTGFRVEIILDDKGDEVETGVYFERPEEYARIEGDQVVFPMTRYNYRMIVFEKKR